MAGRIGEILLLHEAVEPWVLTHTLQEQPGTGQRLVSLLISRAQLDPDGLLVAGFSLRGVAGELTLDEYDAAAAAAGLTLVQRWATWERTPYAGGDYAVSVHGAAT